MRAGGARHRARRRWRQDQPREELVPQVYPGPQGQPPGRDAGRRGATALSTRSRPRFEDLLREIAAGTPVVVLQNLGLFSDGWHYAVAIGYDYPRGTLVLRSGTQEREVMPFAAHEVVWMRSGYWAMVAVPPDRPATAEEKRWLSAIAALERIGQGARRARRLRGLPRERWPENVNARIGLANTHYALGELAQAEAVLREAARGASRSRSWCSTTSRKRCPTLAATRKRCR